MTPYHVNKYKSHCVKVANFTPFVKLSLDIFLTFLIVSITTLQKYNKN